MRAFLEQTQPHHVLAATIRGAEILGMVLDEEDLTRFGEHRDELADLLRCSAWTGSTGGQ